MGIKDLLRFMKPYILPIHIQKYAGTRVTPSFSHSHFYAFAPLLFLIVFFFWVNIKIKSLSNGLTQFCISRLESMRIHGCTKEVSFLRS